MFERWVYVCAMLTGGLAAVAFAMGGNLNSDQFMLWMLMSGGIVLAQWTVNRDPEQAKRIGLAMLLTGLNLCAYNAVKHHLNVVGFGAGPMLVAIDRAIFGTDPIRLLTWLPPLLPKQTYYYGWLAPIAATIAWVAAKHPNRNFLLPLYFTCWTVLGPMIHLMLPAAGPIFYARVGHGPDFLDVPMPEQSLNYSDWLWFGYQRGEQLMGSGISAMPSLHIMTSAWVVLALWNTRIRPLVLAWFALIYLLSIATGWHYAIDGIVSIACIAGAAALHRAYASGWRGNRVGRIQSPA